MLHTKSLPTHGVPLFDKRSNAIEILFDSHNLVKRVMIASSKATGLLTPPLPKTSIHAGGRFPSAKFPLKLSCARTV